MTMKMKMETESKTETETGTTAEIRVRISQTLRDRFRRRERRDGDAPTRLQRAHRSGSERDRGANGRFGGRSFASASAASGRNAWWPDPRCPKRAWLRWTWWAARRGNDGWCWPFAPPSPSATSPAYDRRKKRGSTSPGTPCCSSRPERLTSRSWSGNCGIGWSFAKRTCARGWGNLRRPVKTKRNRFFRLKLRFLNRLSFNGVTLDAVQSRRGRTARPFSSRCTLNGMTPCKYAHSIKHKQSKYCWCPSSHEV